MHEAKTHLSRHIDDLACGRESEIVIAIAGKPAARLVPIGPVRRTLGFAKGTIRLSDDFDEEDPALNGLFEDSTL